MFPDSNFAPSRGSFQTPVSVPATDPDAAPTRTFTIACAWLPFIRGALQQLLLQATWRTSDPAVLLLAQQRAWTLISMFDECASNPLPFACPFDLTLHPSFFVAAADDSSLSPLDQAVWAPGFGWVEQDCFQASSGFNLTVCHIIGTLPAPILATSVQMTYNLTKGSPAPSGFNNGVAAFSGGVLQGYSQIDGGLDPDGVGKLRGFTFGTPTLIDEVHIQLYTHYYPTGTDGSCAVTALEIEGVGFPPC